MNKNELIEQLESLIENAEDFLKDPLSDDIWKKDIECCKTCIKLVEEFIDDNGNIIYDKKTFDTESEAKEFISIIGDSYRNMWHTTCGNMEWWTVNYKK